MLRKFLAAGLLTAVSGSAVSFLWAQEPVTDEGARRPTFSERFRKLRQNVLGTEQAPEETAGGQPAGQPLVGPNGQPMAGPNGQPLYPARPGSAPISKGPNGSYPTYQPGGPAPGYPATGYPGATPPAGYPGAAPATKAGPALPSAKAAAAMPGPTVRPAAGPTYNSTGALPTTAGQPGVRGSGLPNYDTRPAMGGANPTANPANSAGVPAMATRPGYTPRNDGANPFASRPAETSISDEGDSPTSRSAAYPPVGGYPPVDRRPNATTPGGVRPEGFTGSPGSATAGSATAGGYPGARSGAMPRDAEPGTSLPPAPGSRPTVSAAKEPPPFEFGPNTKSDPRVDAASSVASERPAGSRYPGAREAEAASSTSPANTTAANAKDNTTAASSSSAVVALPPVTAPAASTTITSPASSTPAATTAANTPAISGPASTPASTAANIPSANTTVPVAATPAVSASATTPAPAVQQPAYTYAPAAPREPVVTTTREPAATSYPPVSEYRKPAVEESRPAYKPAAIIEQPTRKPFMAVSDNKSERSFGETRPALDTKSETRPQLDNRPMLGESKSAYQERTAERHAERQPQSQPHDEGAADLNAKPRHFSSENDPTLLAGRSPVLEIETAGPRKVTIGKEGVYKIYLRNLGSVAARDVHVDVKVPQWAEVVSMDPANRDGENNKASSVSDGVQWMVRRLKAKSEEELTLKIVPRQGLPFDLSVEVHHAPTAVQAAVEVQEPKLLMAISGPAEVFFGKQEVYKLTLSNPGSGDAEGVELTLLPTTPGEATPTPHKIGTLKAGENKVIELELTARAGGTLKINAVATAANNLRSVVDETILVRKAQLVATMQGAKFRYAGTESVYEVKVTNPGNAMAQNVQIHAMLPQGAKFVSASGRGRFDEENDRIIWQLSNMAPGAEQQVSFTCELVEAGLTRIQVAAVGDNDLKNSCAFLTDVEAVADLTLSVVDPRGPLPTGQEMTYEVTLKNRGTKAAEGVELIGSFSEGVEPISAAGGPQYSIRPGQIMFHSIPLIEPGETLVIKINAKANTPGNHIFRAELACDGIDTRVAKEESTRFYGDDSKRGEDMTAEKPGPTRR